MASGRVADDVPGLVPLVANALGMTVQRASISRATLHGTALIALGSLAPDIERAPVPMAASAEPDPAAAEHTAAVRAGFDRLYGALLS